MADFSSLKQTIQGYIKQNGNEEITGNILQDVLLAMVTTMGDSAINSLASALQDEITARQNQDTTLQGNIAAETTARQQADTALGGRIDGLQTAINGINTKLAEGYIYAGIATISTNPGSPTGKVFYIATAAGTYTDFLDSGSSSLVLTRGINILKYDGTTWSNEQVIGIDEEPVKDSKKLIESGGVFNTSGKVVYDSSILTLTGYVKFDDGTRISSGYHTSDFISVKQGDRINLTSHNSCSVAAISAYSSNTEESYIQGKSVQGVGGSYVSSYKYIVPSGVNYIRLCCSDANATYFSFELYRGAIADIIEIEEKIGNYIYHDSSILLVNGYIKYADGTRTSSGYHTSDFISVKQGDRINLTSHNSGSVAAIAAYSSNTEVSYIQGKSVQGVGGSYVSSYKYIVPSGVNYIRLCCSDTNASYFSFELYRGIEAEEDEQKKLSSVSFIQPSHLLMKSRCSVNFIFDDGNANDASIKELFDDYQLKCGFAVYTVNKRYRDYAKDGFEILAHGTTPLSSADEATIRAAMTAGKKVVNGMGLVCHGWVTPSSWLNPSYLEVTNDFFEYGFTVGKGTQTTDQTMVSTLKSYELWRCHMDTLLTNYQNIFSDAIANNGMVSVYGHGAELSQTGHWTLSDLKNILVYCVAVGIEVLTPYESCLKLFENRHN